MVTGPLFSFQEQQTPKFLYKDFPERNYFYIFTDLNLFLLVHTKPFEVSVDLDEKQPDQEKADHDETNVHCDYDEEKSHCKVERMYEKLNVFQLL